MPFPEMWKALQRELKAGTVISNWTAHNGTIGEPFTVTEIEIARIIVDPPAATTFQPVRKSDFEAIYDRWDDYCHGNMKRSDFSPDTRCSKYVISILNWLAGKLGGKLP